MTRVSVCMATYNGEAYIKSQLLSILGQLSGHDEIIVSDDGSCDHTLDIISGIGDPRIKVFVNPGENSIVRNFENALERAGGEYVFLSDQDDVWEPRKVSTLLSCLTACDLVVSDCRVMDDTGTMISGSFFRLRRSGKGVFKNLAANSYMGACMAFKRKILAAALPFPKHIPMHDWWIGLVGEVCGTTRFCSEKLVQYRRHGNSHSPFMAGNAFGVEDRIKFRLHLALPLARLWLKEKWRNLNPQRKAVI